MGSIKKLSIGLIALFSFVALSPADDFLTQVIGPFGPLNNNDSSLIIPATYAQDLLNVDLAPGGKSIKKRKGYATAFALSVTTSPVHGVYSFYDASGNDVSLFFNDRNMSSSINGNSAVTLFSTGAYNATYQCVDSQGFGYCLNTGHTSLIKTNGSTYSLITTVNSTGSIVAVTPDRLVTSGFTDAPNRIDFSKSADFTTWTPGGLSTDPLEITVSAPGSKITHLVYAFNRIMWFKDTSFGYILDGPTQSDWTVKTVSPNVGTLDNSSIYWEGVLYFRGQDAHIYEFDGATLQKMTRDVQGTISGSQQRRSNSWLQTTQTDFSAGAQNPAGWLDTTTVSGQIGFVGASAISPFVDTAQGDFQAGTLTNLDATTNPGNLSLSLLSTGTVTAQMYITTNTRSAFSYCSNNSGYGLEEAFKPSVTGALASVSIEADQAGVSSYMLLRADSSNTPGAIISQSSINSSNGSLTEFNYTFPSTASAVIAGTRYWVQLVQSGSCGAGNVIWYRRNSTDPGPESDAITSVIHSPSQFNFKVFTASFNASGNIVSQAFDVGFTTSTWLWNWGTLTGTSVRPANTAVTYETQTASATTGTWEGLTAVNSGSKPGSTVQRYIRYKASFTTTDISTSPVLNDVTISMTNRLHPAATFYSAVDNAPNITSWDAFQYSGFNSGGNNAFSIRSANGPFSVLSSTPSTWTPVSNGGIPSLSTGSYFQLADYMTATVPTSPVALYDFTVNWFEGQATDKAYGIYHRDALWWAFSAGAGATTNNKILRYDLLNRGWLLYDIPMDGMYVRNQSLFFGSPSAGYIYKFGDTDNDAGSAINAYWKSKDFFADSPFLDKDFKNISVFGNSVVNSTVTVSFTIDASSTTSYSVPFYKTNRALTRNTRNLPLGTMGTTINIKYGNNAADQPFEVFGGGIGYIPKSWNVGQ